MHFDTHAPHRVGMNAHPTKGTTSASTTSVIGTTRTTAAAVSHQQSNDNKGCT
ncbi:hypothetical protein G4G28_05715 [Massilia sp. Dwa41.01b]|uniref:hypothetical protein n=1 Tax=unclassified Massilia TaxID=2609279 RepID=UPI001600D2AE|nr:MULTISPECIES: hypothetical protein [unclassified Massilia]QNA88115.1 hypothetical protein G4G28_05715 [Massilia sp. Dwa41.01b]QNA99023.1 hypothetical protein G4G31_09435 [Massilia sp. Se16.2.3]